MRWIYDFFLISGAFGSESGECRKPEHHFESIKLKKNFDELVIKRVRTERETLKNCGIYPPPGKQEGGGIG